MRKFLIKTIFCLGLFLIFSLPAKAAMIGQQQLFYVDSSYDLSNRNVIKTTLQGISERGYFYTEDDWWNNLTSINSSRLIINDLAKEFDEKIYPKMIKVYGSPWEPGIDNDPKITVLISRMKEGAGGYFNSADEYLRERAPLSNEREMIYINALYFDSPRAKGFLAHEFQHLINFYQKEKLRGVTEEIWLNEARSEYASTLLGYDDILAGSNLEKRILDFFKNPSDSLTEWSEMTSDYGSINLFMQYLVSHFGEQILTKMMQSSSVGIASINGAFSTSGFKENFSNVFANWTIANYLNDCKIDGQKYCYLNTSLSEKIKVLPTVSHLFPSSGIFSANWTDFIKDWAGHWYKFSGGNSNFKIDFKGGENTSFKVAYLIERTDGPAEVKFIRLDASQQGFGFVQNFGSDVKSVILVPVSQTKTVGFGSVESFHRFSYQANLTEEVFNPETSNFSSFVTTTYPDGSLIRAGGDYKVYIIKNGFKRWIQSGEIFKFYPHLTWKNIIEVTPQEKDWYRDAWLVRVEGDTRVYEINGDGTKHWLNMTAEQFSQTGRNWDMVYIINKTEWNWYKAGADVLFR